MSEQPTFSAKKTRGKAKIRGLSLFPVRINGIDSWRVVCPTVNGQRLVKTFRDQREAQTFYEARYNHLRASGAAGLQLGERQRVDALAALDILSQFNVTLEESAEFYAEHHEAIAESQTVAHTIEKLLLVR